MGLHERAYILPGLMPMKSAKVLQYLAKHVLGVIMSHELIARMKAAEDQKEEGIKTAIETVQELRNIEGVKGGPLDGLYVGAGGHPAGESNLIKTRNTRSKEE